MTNLIRRVSFKLVCFISSSAALFSFIAALTVYYVSNTLSLPLKKIPIKLRLNDFCYTTPKMQMAFGMLSLFLGGAFHVLEVLLSFCVISSHTLYTYTENVAYDHFRALLDWCNPFTNPEAKELELEISDDLLPVVLVHGTFGYGKGRFVHASYFGGAEKMDKRVLVPDLGALASLHDRARELFYFLKGGEVDYGAQHSKDCGHSQFGKDYGKGNYPEWDEAHPIHFVGHSSGSQVVRILQQMLANKEFTGYQNTSAKWVLSLTSISGALNGSTRTYIEGMQIGDYKTVKTVSLAQLLVLGTIFYEWFDVPWLKRYYGNGFNHFNMSWRKAGFTGLIDCLMGKSGPFASGDWIIPDLTIEGSMQINRQLETFPDTFYFSYANTCTKKLKGITVPSNLFKIHPVLHLKTLQMGLWNLPADVLPALKRCSEDEWKENDGVVNTISMTHPRIPTEHPSHLVADDDLLPHPGIWYYKILEADHLYFVMDRRRAGIEFDQLYNHIFWRCRNQFIRKKPAALQNEANKMICCGNVYKP